MPEEITLIADIYEAAILSDRWPSVLQQVAGSVGAKGATLMAVSPGGSNYVASDRLAETVAAFFAEKWHERNDLAAPLLAEMYPGFRSQTDYWSPEAIARSPVQAGFFIPRGLIGGAATFFQGLADHAIHLSFDGFGSHAGASTAVATFDSLRPHLGRALALSTQVSARRSDDVIRHLELGGVGAAVIGDDGALRASNAIFERRLAAEIATDRTIFRFVDRALNAQFLAARMERGEAGQPVRSIAVPPRRGERPLAIHVLPLIGRGRDILDGSGVMLLLADPANLSLPEPDLLRLLFDLTPTEARLARMLIEGVPLAQAARALSVRDSTARVHLRRIFAKTGVKRQAELVALLRGIGAPVGEPAAT